jgi:energy-coupling factor transport system permease protein
MSFSFDLYVPRESWLHRLDPRVKIIFLPLAMIMILAVINIYLVLTMLALTHILLLSAKIPVNKIKWVWKMMLPITILIPLLWPLFYQDPGGTVLLQFWRIHITFEAFIQGIAMAFRINALCFACFIIMFTTDQASMVRGMVKMGLPFNWGLILAIALRYVPTFYGIINMVMEAQQARGLNLKQGGFLKRVRSYMPIFVAAIITGLRTSDNLAMSLETRAFGVNPRQRTYYRELKFVGTDVAVLVIFLCLFTATVFARFQFGFGTEVMTFLPQVK